MPPVIPFGPVMLVIGVAISVVSANGYVEHLATPPMELDLAAHPLSLHVWGFAGGVFAALAGCWMTVREHRERRERLQEERDWEFRYERTPPRAATRTGGPMRALASSAAGPAPAANASPYRRHRG